MLERVGNPVRIIADTTRKCNLNCWYCHSTSGPFYKGPELEGKDLVNIYDASEKAKVFNITVISVLDRTNFDRWPELTQALIGMGINQHHLSPVCFAGGAMEVYKGL